MNPNFRPCVAFALALCTVCPRPALADSKCKVAFIAKFPVTMDGSRATVAVKINGKDTRVWFDSGAFFSFMPKAKAAELGLATEPLPSGFIVSGIGGSFTPELATVRDFGIVGAQLHNMQFVVGGSDVGNGFLGANFLGVRDTEFDLAKGAINLFSESGCGHYSMAYWADGMAVGEARLLGGEDGNDHHIYVEVLVNGHPLRAMLDTGMPVTMVYRRAAMRAGIDLASPKVVASGSMSGVGSGKQKSWIARTETISIGGEEIRNSPIRILDGDAGFGTTDMLLGMDFLISHHVLVSQAQRKVYLTYNGGPIFSVTTDGEIGHMETRAVGMGSAEKAAEPKTADEFAGRASGKLTRNDVPGAITDFTAAIKLAPERSDLLASRATAYFRGGHADLGASDIDAALLITPTDYRLLIRRAQLRLAKKTLAGALADTDAAAAATPKGSLQTVAVVHLYERLGKADRGPALLDPVLALHRDDNKYAALLDARSWNRALVNTDLDRALKDCDTALRKSGPNTSLLNTRALVQFRRKAYALAITDASAAIVMAPRDTYALFFRGLARSASGDDTGSKADFAAARAINADIDTRFADYGLVAPKAEKPAPAQPLQPGEDAENGQ